MISMTLGQAMPEACAHSCKELLYVQILGCTNIPTNLESLTLDGLQIFHQQGRFLQHLPRRLGERKFTKKIPDFQSAISGKIERLTALNIILIR